MFTSPGTRANRQSFRSLLLRRLSAVLPAPSDGAELFARRRAGRYMAAQIGPSGRDYEFQPLLGTRKVGIYSTLGNGAGASTIGIPTVATVGTSTTRSVANTSLLASIQRLGYVPASAAINTGTGIEGSAQYWRGNATGLGGFEFIGRFGFNTYTAGNRLLAGLCATASADNANPSAKIDSVFVGFDATDTTFQIMSNDASGTATKINTGITPVATKLYVVRIFCAPNAGSVFASIEVMDDGAVFSTELTSDLPTNTVFMLPQMRANTGTQTTGAQIDVATMISETEN